MTVGLAASILIIIMTVQIVKPNRVLGAQTALRAVDCLQVLAASSAPVSVADMAREAGLEKTAAYRILKSLEERSIVAREPNGRRYMVGSGLIALAAMVMQRVNIRTLAGPVMAMLSELTSETIALHIRHARQRVCIQVIDGKHPIRRVMLLGQTLPLYSGPGSKAILAFLPGHERAAILAWAGDAGYDSTQIESLLQRIREQGYFAAVGDGFPGAGGLAVPVFDHSGVVASLTVSGPEDRWNMDAMESVAPLLVRECQALSRSLGSTRVESPSLGQSGHAAVGHRT